MIRFSSLDAFRGLTIALMILVNSPGNRDVYALLEHAVWDGCTLADLVFPFFLLMVGTSAVLSLSSLQKKGASNATLMKKIMHRSVYLFLMGLLLNILPNHFDLSHLRVLGVLQRIAICYFFAAILFLRTSMRTQMIIVGVLLIGYWLLMSIFVTFYGPLSPSNNPIGPLDQWLLSSKHLYTDVFDPEGVLSTVPALASTLIGNLLGFILKTAPTKRQALRSILLRGVFLSVLGFLWHFYFLFNKDIWSSSYVLWTGGLGLITFAGCFFLIEMKGRVSWSTPFVLFGKNAMMVYFLHVLCLKLQAIILVANTQGEVLNLRRYLTQVLFHGLSSINASLAYAITYTLFWFLLLMCSSRLNAWCRRRKRGGDANGCDTDRCSATLKATSQRFNERDL